MTAFEIWRNASNGRVVIRKTDDDGCITGAEKIYPNGLLVITEEQREAIEGRAVSPSLNMFTNGTLTLVSTGGSGGGASVHNDLSGRTAADAHPQAAVTGLAADLAAKVPSSRTVAGLDLSADRSAADVRGALGVGTAQVLVTDPNGADLATGDGKAYLTVPAAWNGKSVLSIHAGLTTASSSGTPTVQVARIRGGTPVDVLSTAVTIDATELTSYTATTPPVVDTANDDLSTGDLLRVDTDVAGTGAKGLMVLIAVG